MKKTLSFIIACIAAFVMIMANETNAKTIAAKAPSISASMKPAIAKYRNGDYLGAMIDLEKVVKDEKDNTYAKYYLALCYTRLGYKEDAQALYNEVVKKNANPALTHYSQRAIDCLDDPESEACKPPKKEEEKPDDITEFIQSGRQIHPMAMDRIIKNRMERQIEEEEYQRKMQEVNGLQSNASMPTNEEIASALNTLSKIGMNLYSANPLLQANQFAQYPQLGLLGNNNTYAAFLGNGNKNPDLAQMMLLNQMSGQQNNMLNYFGM